MPYQDTILEINLKNLEDNYKYLRKTIGPKVKMLAVIKAFGYGTDAVTIAKALDHLGIDYVAVAYAQEGMILRQAGINTPILALHPQQARYDELIGYKITPCIYSFKTLSEFIAASQTFTAKTLKIHLKFNTGINRIGFKKEDLLMIHRMLKPHRNIKVEGVLSHFAASEDPNEREFTKQQIQDFIEIQKNFEQLFGHKATYHICNTSGILNYPEAHFSMVRAGIGLFGYGNHHKFNPHLKPVAALRSVISQINLLEPGDSLGYSRAFIAKKQTKTATIPIGYADGISRTYGNGNGYITVSGKQAPIIGNVCMDMLMVDVTEIDCNEGDIVTIYDDQHSAVSLSNTSGSISYELITAIAARVKRIIIS